MTLALTGAEGQVLAGVAPRMIEDREKLLRASKGKVAPTPRYPNLRDYQLAVSTFQPTVNMCVHANAVAYVALLQCLAAYRQSVLVKSQIMPAAL